MQLETSLTGPFPRSEALVQATRDLDRGRTTMPAVQQLFDATESEVVRIEQAAGLTFVTGGLLRQADLFRPVAETWSGFTVGPLTRWFETNSFFRQPILHHPPERTPGALAARLPAAARASGHLAKAILPGPYTLANLLENRSGETPEALVHRFGRLLGAEAAELRTAGYAAVQFQEPLLVVRPPEGPAAESVVAAYRSIAEGAGTMPTTVWTFFGPAGPAWPVLQRLPVGTVGVDLSETELPEIRELTGSRALGLGVIDPRTSLPEDPAELAPVVEGVARRSHVDRILLGPGGPLDLLPWATATRKIATLPQTVAAIGGRP